MNFFSTQAAKLLSDLEDSHAHFHESAVFSGPSLHFHQSALVDAKAGDIDQFTQSSYAMLASWGMHRMGRGGAKMDDFPQYRSSIHAIWPCAESLRECLAKDLAETEWEILRQAFIGIKAIKGAFSLVANSKVLAHALPNLMPPVDRQYTIAFLWERRPLPTNIDGEWSLLQSFLKDFFYPVLAHETFVAAHVRWSSAVPTFPWDTSALKAIDNVVVGHVRRRRTTA